jgi:hypothetical protein
MREYSEANAGCAGARPPIVIGTNRINAIAHLAVSGVTRLHYSSGPRFA